MNIRVYGGGVRLVGSMSRELDSVRMAASSRLCFIDVNFVLAVFIQKLVPIIIRSTTRTPGVLG
jgi:hypothetical protein